MVTETVLFYTHSSSHLTGIVSKLRFNFNRAIVFFSVYDNSINFTIPLTNTLHYRIQLGML